MISLRVIGEVLQVIGTIIVGYLALSVHRHVKHERKIDSHVFIMMGKEQKFGWIALIAIAVGFILEIVGR